MKRDHFNLSKPMHINEFPFPLFRARASNLFYQQCHLHSYVILLNLKKNIYRKKNSHRKQIALNSYISTCSVCALGWRMETKLRRCLSGTGSRFLINEGNKSCI